MDTITQEDNRSNSSFLKQHQLSLFFIFTLLLSAGIAAIATILGDKNITILSVFTPSLVAIILTAFVAGKSGLKDLLVNQITHRFKLRWLITALIIFPVLTVLAISLHSLFGGPDLALRTTEVLPPNDCDCTDCTWGRVWMAGVCTPETARKI